ncbi:MAG TPA: phosphoribosylamine--glycine ligase [Planctomycetota bacterium]|nr:phosphoribosylamine--glycine ligase [Planctomycetota bacterium]
MKVLVVGGGGREHALCWKIAQSPRVKHVLCAPGNAGIARTFECRPVRSNDVDGLVALAESEKVDLTVVGPEEPLCLGLVDRLDARGKRAFGPTAAAAQIEGSKAFCKDLLRRHRVPTPSFRAFEDIHHAMAFVETTREFPIVVKASGLAAGKGVVVCEEREQAREALQRMMETRSLGDAGATVVIEEFARGPELSVLAITDGSAIVPLEPARDHKRLLDHDAGPNTGGMGAVSPVSIPPRLRLQIEQQILLPVIHAMNREGRRFRGVLYAGLVLGAKGPVVLEFNARFGDPEAQAILARFADDLVPYLEAAASGTLESLEGPRFDPRVAITVVAASEGYPEDPKLNRPVAGLDEVVESDALHVFHSGTATAPGGAIATSGGRVLSVTALGATVEEARVRAYDAVDRIRFAGKQVRRDIGLQRSPA